MKRLGVTLGAILVVSLLAGCSSDSAPSTPAQTVELTAESMSFGPKEITVKKGAPVKLVFSNKDAMLHDFSIDKIPASVKESKGDDHGHEAAAAIHVAADSGKSGTLEFTPNEAGVYTFYCTVAGHKEAGMTGKLIVQ